MPISPRMFLRKFKMLLGDALPVNLPKISFLMHFYLQILQNLPIFSKMAEGDCFKTEMFFCDENVYAWSIFGHMWPSLYSQIICQWNFPRKNRKTGTGNGVE